MDKFEDARWIDDGGGNLIDSLVLILLLSMESRWNDDVVESFLDNMWFPNWFGGGGGMDGVDCGGGVIDRVSFGDCVGCVGWVGAGANGSNNNELFLGRDILEEGSQIFLNCKFGV